MGLRMLRKYLLPYLGVYLLTLLFYWAVSLNLVNTSLYLQVRRFALAALAACLPFFLLPGLRLRQAWPAVLLAAAYAITAPLLAYISFSKTAAIITNHLDIAFGLYLLPVLLFGQYFLSRLGPTKIMGRVVSAFELLLFLPIVFQIAYFSRFQHCVTINGMMAVYQTNAGEALEYLQSMGVVALGVPLAALLALGWALQKGNVRLGILFANLDLPRKRNLISAFLALAIAGYAFGAAYKRTYFNELLLATRNYFQQLGEFKTHRQDFLAQLQVKQHSQNRGTILLVIGESASRDYMSAFTAMTDDTTPWLHRQQGSDNFLFFGNSYACAAHTVPVLEHALTEADYYNKKAFYRAVSLLDMAKKAGYKIYWFSNQGLVGIYDTPITLVAQTAAVSRWIVGDAQLIDWDKREINRHYDESLLDYLQLVDPKEKNFVVFHLMGSHMEYNNRYPASFQKWTDPGETGRLADYKNSLLYTDKVLEGLFERARQTLPLSAFVYCSDHGADPHKRRNPDASDFVTLRIPLVVYLAEDYIKENPQEYAALRAHQDAYWSNDLLYDLLCGLMKLESRHVTPSKNLASSAYSYDKKTIKVGVGKKRAADDPHLQE